MASVYFMKKLNKYAAQVTRDGVRRHLGVFTTPEEAEKVAREYESKLPQRNPLASKPSHKELNQDRVRELFNYDSETGIFTWKARTSKRINVGDVAGHDTYQGYVAIRIDGRLYLAHWVVWMFVYGRFPNSEIDHIDGNGRNNSLSNLRECDRGENGQNTRVRKDNKLKITGVHKRNDTGKYTAEIMVGGIKKNLGCFVTVDEAKAAYTAAKKVAHTFNPVQRGS